MFKHRLIKFLSSILFWALLIAAVAGWFINRSFSEYKIAIVKSETSKERDTYFSDLDNNGTNERILYRNKKNYQSITVFDHDYKFIYELSLTRHFLPNFSGSYIKDVDNDGMNEIFFVTQHIDSLFFNCIKFNKQFEATYSYKFISTVFQNFKNEHDAGGYFIQNQFDINNDGFNEVLLFIAAGYSYYPRKVYAYDFHNDSIYSSPTQGIFTGGIKLADSKPDGKSFLMCNTMAVNNYDAKYTNIPYPDTSAWLLVLDNKLKHLFNPIEFKGKGSTLFVTDVLFHDTTYFLSCNGNFKTNSNLKFQLYNTKGKFIKEIENQTLKFNDIIFIYDFYSQMPDRMLFTNKGRDVYFINKNVSKIEQKKIDFSENEACTATYIFDLNHDGTPEQIFVGNSEIVVYQDNFTSPCRLHIQNINFANASYYKTESETLTCLQSADLLYFISYQKNEKYIFKYVIIFGVFLFAMAFLFVFQKARTYQLEKDNIRLNSVVKQRTKEVITKNEILNQQNEEIHAQAEHLKELVKQLQTLDDFKQNLTAMIVHDLKNPLNFIINQSFNQKITQVGRQMLNMVSNILDIQKFEETKMNINAESRNLNQTFHNAVKQIDYLLEEKNLVLMNYIDTHIDANYDDELIERVFVNLLSNAIKYSPYNEMITIKSTIITENENKYIKIEILDKGLGIPQGFIPIIFDKFSQNEVRKLGITQSTGLGLTFCKYAVEANQGTIGVQSQMGFGSSFWFTLPTDFSCDVLENKAVEISKTKKEIQLSVADKEYLFSFTEKLKTTEFFAFTELQEILKEIDASKSSEIEKWKMEIQKNVLNFNELEYNKIIALIYE